jgi:hypothetical protein
LGLDVEWQLSQTIDKVLIGVVEDSGILICYAVPNGEVIESETCSTYILMVKQLYSEDQGTKFLRSVDTV